jgi:nicotinate dehydrogenase subunit A
VSVIFIVDNETHIKEGRDMQLTLNGKKVALDIEAEMPLLWAIRDEAGLTGTKFGCGVAQCGACTVLVNGEAVRSCITPATAVKGKSVTTLEGLGSSAKPGLLQQAFIDTQAVQCGYCINGMIMSAQALLKKNKKPTDAQINEALAGHLCRCGTHQRIVAAVKQAVTA